MGDSMSLQRRTTLQRGKGLGRKAPAESGSAKGLRRSQPRRDWTVARAKVEREGGCRAITSWDGAPLGGVLCDGPIEAAHIIGRVHDEPEDYVERVNQTTWKVFAHRIVPLCRAHHRAYDAHEIDILQALSLDEQLQAVKDAGSLELARKRTAPSQYRSIP